MDHTGELELVLEAPTEAGIFVEALAALRALLGPGDGAPVRRAIDLGAADPGLLLVAWLDELVYLAEVDGLVPEHVESIAVGGGRLRATVAGRRGRPPHLVKAVTLNSLELAERREGEGWHARVVLDV